VFGLLNETNEVFNGGGGVARERVKLHGKELGEDMGGTTNNAMKPSTLSKFI